MVKVSTSNISFCSSLPRQDNCNEIACNNPGAKPVLDDIIKDSVELENSQEKAPFLKKLLTYPSLSTIPLIPLLAGELFIFGKILVLKNQVKKSIIPEEKLSEHYKKMPKRFLILAALAIPIGFAMNFLNNKYKTKHEDKALKIVNDFNKENDTNVKLKTLKSTGLLIAALCDPVSGQIIQGERLNEDFILANIHQKYLLKHELVHMKQYMLIACSEGGIEKLNYLAVKKLSDVFDENAKKEVYDAYQEIKNGVNDKYKNAAIDRFGYKINIVDYITALYKVIYEKDTKPEDLPIIINKDLYQQVRAKKGKLSPEEEKKAQEYLKAYENYPKKVGFTEVFNPNSNYRQNLLEKEAYKMNPWYTL